jgi:hypothetical protein
MDSAITPFPCTMDSAITPLPCTMDSAITAERWRKQTKGGLDGCANHELCFAPRKATCLESPMIEWQAVDTWH